MELSHVKLVLNRPASGYTDKGRHGEVFMVDVKLDAVKLNAILCSMIRIIV